MQLDWIKSFFSSVIRQNQTSNIGMKIFEMLIVVLYLSTFEIRIKIFGA